MGVPEVKITVYDDCVEARRLDKQIVVHVPYGDGIRSEAEARRQAEASALAPARRLT